MIPKEIIAKAIEGGWKPEWAKFSAEGYDRIEADEEFVSFKKGREVLLQVFWHLIALDPSFWQALGKALGWGQTSYCWGCDYDEGATTDTEKWFVNAHHFYDLILTGGDTAEFWQSLLTSKE